MKNNLVNASFEEIKIGLKSKRGGEKKFSDIEKWLDEIPAADEISFSELMELVELIKFQKENDSLILTRIRTLPSLFSNKNEHLQSQAIVNWLKKRDWANVEKLSYDELSSLLSSDNMFLFRAKRTVKEKWFKTENAQHLTKQQIDNLIKLSVDNYDKANTIQLFLDTESGKNTSLEQLERFVRPMVRDQHKEGIIKKWLETEAGKNIDSKNLEKVLGFLSENDYKYQLPIIGRWFETEGGKNVPPHQIGEIMNLVKFYTGPDDIAKKWLKTEGGNVDHEQIMEAASSTKHNQNVMIIKKWLLETEKGKNISFNNLRKLVDFLFNQEDLQRNRNINANFSYPEVNLDELKKNDPDGLIKAWIENDKDPNSQYDKLKKLISDRTLFPRDDNFVTNVANIFSLVRIDTQKIIPLCKYLYPNNQNSRVDLLLKIISAFSVGEGCRN